MMCKTAALCKKVGAILLPLLLLVGCQQLLNAPTPNARFEPLDLSESVGVSVIDLIGDVPTVASPEQTELVLWAMQDWARVLDGRLRFHMVKNERDALVRVRFVPSRTDHYGEMFPFNANGKRGANIYVRGDADKLGRVLERRARRDDLFLATVVYATVLHELGHALGLGHSMNSQDIMYAMVMGGDVEQYLLQFRHKLSERTDLANKSVLSFGDRANLRALYAK